MTTQLPPVPGSVAGIPPEVASRLASELVERWVRRAVPPGGDPRLSAWSYDVARATRVGQWSSSARVARRIDRWLRSDVVTWLAAPLVLGAAGCGRLLVWERPGRPELGGVDLAWYAAWQAWSRDDDAAFLVVTRAGWMSVPDGTVGRRRLRRAGR